MKAIGRLLNSLVVAMLAGCAPPSSEKAQDMATCQVEVVRDHLAPSSYQACMKAKGYHRIQPDECLLSGNQDKPSANYDLDCWAKTP